MMLKGSIAMTRLLLPTDGAAYATCKKSNFPFMLLYDKLFLEILYKKRLDFDSEVTHIVADI